MRGRIFYFLGGRSLPPYGGLHRLIREIANLQPRIKPCLRKQ
nr:MAG TPA: hypothetical protein [Caudoviricetes sp.]